MERKRRRMGMKRRRRKGEGDKIGKWKGKKIEERRLGRGVEKEKDVLLYTSSLGNNSAYLWCHNKTKSFFQTTHSSS